MNQCYVCGNQSAKSFDIIMNGRSYRFDCFECAIHTLAPNCKQCKCKIIGHSVEGAGNSYCCAHCAIQGGVAKTDLNVAE